jgi:hypothetical protein
MLVWGVCPGWGLLTVRLHDRPYRVHSDQIYENADVNYMYLITRLVISYAKQPLLPPPLNLLHWVGQVAFSILRACGRCGGGNGSPDGYVRIQDSSEDDFTPDNPEVAPDAAPTASPSARPWSKRYKLRDFKDYRDSTRPHSPSVRARSRSMRAAQTTEDSVASDEEPSDLVEEVLYFLSEHEHSELVEERWRKGFSMSLGSLDRKVARSVDSISRKLEDTNKRIGDMEGTLANKLQETLEALKPQMSDRRIPGAPAIAEESIAAKNIGTGELAAVVKSETSGLVSYFAERAPRGKDSKV